MISFLSGNIFKSECQALVNPVNTQGVMGKGLALEFRRRYPENFQEYRTACHKKQLQAGQILPVRCGTKIVINLPTKLDWRDGSSLDLIEQGLYALDMYLLEQDLKSVAIPALGCGLGGLGWSEVKPLIERTFGKREIQVEVFLPRALFL